MRKNLFLLIVFVHFFTLSKGQIVHIENDTSKIEEYYALGIPIVNRIWSASDYTKSVEIIEQIKKADINKLPLKKGVESSVIFDKLTNTDRYEFLNEDIYDFNTRFTSLLEVLGSIRKLLVIYISSPEAKSKKLKFSNEISAATISILFLSEQEIEFVKIFINDNPNLTETQQKGISQIKYGINSIIGGMLLTIEKDYPLYEREDIKILSESFFPFYKSVNSFLDQNACNEFSKRINLIAQTHEYEEIKKLASSAK